MVIAVRTERRSGGLEVVKHAGTDADKLRLQHEAHQLARAAHPGVVEVVETGPSTLRLRHAGTALAQLGPLAPDHAAAVVRRVATTTVDLHRMGIAHGRITDDHVVVGADGRPRLCGFAGAGDADDERCAADVAALGRLLADMLDRSDGVLWSPALRGVRAATRRARALRGFRTAVAAATDPEPARRPSASQFAATLHAALPELSLPTHPAEDVTGPPAPGTPPDRVSQIPAEPDPTGELAWTDDDLSFLAADDGGDLSWSWDDALGDDETPPSAGDDADEADPPPTRTAAPEPDPDEPLRIEIRPPAAMQGDPPAGLRPGRGVLALVAAAVLIVGIVAGSALARAVRPFGGGASSTPAATDTTAPGEGPAPGGEDEGAEPLRPPSFAEGCVVPDQPGPDADGDGCPDPVVLEGRVATVGTVRVELGAEGDLVALGDPDCDGVVTPAVLRPSTGEVFVFPSWSLSAPVEVEATTVVVDGARIDGASCARFVVTDTNGAEIAVGEAGP